MNQYIVFHKHPFGFGYLYFEIVQISCHELFECQLDTFIFLFVVILFQEELACIRYRVLFVDYSTSILFVYLVHLYNL